MLRQGWTGAPFPGDELNEGHYANFADINTTFQWRDVTVNDGCTP